MASSGIAKDACRMRSCRTPVGEARSTAVDPEPTHRAARDEARPHGSSARSGRMDRSPQEENVPRPRWRRRTTDNPGPAGRRWGRLRRGGSLARQVLVGGRGLVGRVGRRRGAGGVTTITPSTPTRLAGSTDLAWRQADLPTARLGYGARGADAVAPVSPAMPPRADYALDGEPDNLVIPLLPGERTMSRRIKFAVANGCTVASLLLGMAAAFLAINGELRLAAIAILACVVFDGCD